MRWILLAIVLFQCGCRPATKPPATAVSPVVEPETVATATAVAEETQPPAVTPRIRARSPEQVRQRIRDTVALMRDQAESRGRRQALQQVASAMVLYRDRRLRLPQDTKTLSWRVALLPFLGEHLLYADFLEEEPWDSTHNELLIARMPHVFGDDPLGLTRLHVMLGGKSPSSVMLIESGVDQQETWTRPREEPFEATMVPEWIALRDGTVCRVDQKIALVAWQEWLRQPSESLPVWLEKLGAQTTIHPVDVDSANAKSASRPLALSADSLCVLSVQPQKLLANPQVQAVFQHVMSDATGETSPLRTVIGSSGRRNLTAGVSWLQDRGMGLAQMESIAMVIPEQVLSGSVQSAELFACLCRTSGSIDVEGVITREMELSPGYQFREQGATAGIIDPARSFALHFADDATIVAGGQLLVQKLSVAQPADSKLTAWMSEENAAPLVIAVKAEPLRQLWQQRPQSVPPMVQEIVTSLLDAEDAVVTMNPDANEFLTVKVFFRQSTMAKQAHVLWSKHIEQQRAALPKQSPDLQLNVWGAWFYALLHRLESDCQGQVVRFTITRPERFEELVHALTMPAVTKK